MNIRVKKVHAHLAANQKAQCAKYGCAGVLEWCPSYDEVEGILIGISIAMFLNSLEAKRK
jgi:hypothetical protein